MAGKSAYSPLFAKEGNQNDSKYVPINSSLEEPEEDNSRSKFLSGRKKIFVAGFVAVFVISAVSIAAVLGTRSADYFLGSRKARSSDKLTFDDAFNGKFSARSYSLTWLTDDTLLHSTTDGVKKYDLTKNSSSIFLSADIVATHGETYTLSPDKKWIMFKENSTQLYRHSTYSDYYIGTLADKVFTKLKLPTGALEKIRYATWCGKSDSLVIVFRNNVYFKHSPTSPTWYQITTDGVPKAVFNGVPDWVYEEEVLSTDNALDFSEDGKYMVFAKFNSSKVKYYKFTKYGPRQNAYTSIEKIAYPKAGYTNPVVLLYAVNLEDVMSSLGTVTLIPLEVPTEFKAIDHYYYLMRFVKGSKVTTPQVYVSWMNRAQNHTITRYYDLASSTKRTVEEHKVKGGWVDDAYAKPKFAADGSYYINLLPKSEGEAGSFTHVAQVNTEPKKQSVVFLTAGKYDIHDIICFDPVEQIVYFRSTQTSPADRHLYQVNVKTKKKKCITCGFADDDGCSYYYIKFSKQCSWGSFSCQGPSLPQTKLRNMKKNGKDPVIVENNKILKENLATRAMPVKVKYSIKSDGFDLPIQEIRPHKFNPERKHAVLFSVYGGPGTQSVTNAYSMGWEQFLVSNYDIIVVEFDARGSGYYGDKFLHATYKHLGKYEAKDANAVARYLGTKSYIDKDRIAIWGWSYGGFYSASVLASGENVFKTAIAVAPVTDWRYYDTIYTERYMGLPTKADNFKGYEETSVLPRANNFAGRDFLLIHGTGDDNVHAQQTMQLANALVANKVQFRMQLYPDRAHGISSHGSYTHLYRAMTSFLERNLPLKSY